MSCPACRVGAHGMCALCECGLAPLAGLNPTFVIQLARMLDLGSRSLGRRKDESVIGHVARLGREQAETQTNLRSPRFRDPPYLAEHRILSLARERGLVSAGEDGVTSEMLDDLYERGLLEAVSVVDGHVMSAAPKDTVLDTQPETKRQGPSPAERLSR